ncbi:processed acidic surface protein [Bacillus salitolerans]|uniref:Processed acidic surface protein n=1 Tax=Bacillus salitolerans TaxID=1437434 RepID=A0ABW4LW69_9BACI
MIRYVLLTALGFLYFLPCNVIAAPPEDELTQYVNELNWTQDELIEYLDFYEYTLNDFHTMAALKEVLGTPISDDNLKNLLITYDMSLEEADDLLAQFGESIHDYKFIEDLELALDFYLNHNEAMAGLTDFLAYVGLTDEELTILFEHISSLDEDALQSKIKQINAKIEQYSYVNDTTELSKNQRQDLLNVFIDVLASYQLSGKFFLADDMDGTGKSEITFEQLLQLNTLNGKSILVELYNTNGVLIADLSLSDEMVASDFILQTGEQFAHIGEIAGELNQLMHGERLPVTASSYITHALIGFLLLGTGFIMYVVQLKKEAR